MVLLVDALVAVAVFVLGKAAASLPWLTPVNEIAAHDNDVLVGHETESVLLPLVGFRRPNT